MQTMDEAVRTKAPATNYVAGLMFNPERDQVALIRKLKPEWQRGRLNAIGGKVEPGEIPVIAMCREFAEETGVDTSIEDWTPVAKLEGEGFAVFFYAAFTDAVFDVRTMEEEEVYVGHVAGFLASPDLIPNLKVFIPLAKDVTIAKPVSLTDLPGVVDPDSLALRTVPIDPRTGRPLGDHGTALQAISFALDTSQGLECEDFLRAWREGDLDEWPDFYEYLRNDEAGAAPAVTA